MNRKNRANAGLEPSEGTSSGLESPLYVLKLYTTGITTNSARAIVNIRKICEEHLQGRYELEVIDLASDPALAQDEQIVAAPTLIKKLPLPLRRFIGDMTE